MSSGGMGGMGGMGQMGGMGMMNRGGYRPQRPGYAAGQSGIPPWANQNGGNYQNASDPFAGGVPVTQQQGPGPTSNRMVPSGSGAPFTNFRFNPDGTSASGAANPMMPITGGQDYFNSPTPSFQQPRTGGNDMFVMGDNGDGSSMNRFGASKPAPYQPQQPVTGGQDYFNAPPPYQNAQPSGPMTGGLNVQSAQAPQSWEQMNSQLLRPQQLQDPGMLAQAKAGQSGFPGLTPQQMANVNRIGSNPVGGGAALNDYLLSIGYSGALQPGQSIR